MGYEGPDLAALFDESEEAFIGRLCHDLADVGGSTMTKRIKELTPIGHQPFAEGYIPGHLHDSITQKIVVVTISGDGTRYETGTETNVSYAEYVEEGTGLWGPRRAKYEIRPKNPNGWLRFFDQKTGEIVFAKRVMHPGSPGHHMFAKGVALTEAEFDKLAEEHVERYVREADARWTEKARTRRIRS